ncbi:MAG: hypothetical protein P8J59_12140 [Phycisphaerales bacterium]|nr:hypothetical protein [Phycisphaerales bacterium]
MLRRRRMPPAPWATMGLSLILGFGSEAPSQSLDLDDRPAFPELTRSVLDDIVERCADDGDDRRNETESHATVVAEAGRNIRRIAIELANRGGGTGDAATVAGLMAIRLSAGLSQIDELLESVARPGAFVGSPPRPVSEERRVAAIERLRDFNRSGLDVLRRSDTGTLRELDTTLSTVLAPIRRAISLISGRPITTRWPSVESKRSLPGASSSTLTPLPERARALEADRAMANAGDGASGGDTLNQRRLLRASIHAVDSIESESPLRESLDGILDSAILRLIDDPSDRQGRAGLLVVRTGARIDDGIEILEEKTSSSEFDADRFRSVLQSTVAGPVGDSTLLLLDRQLEIVVLLEDGINALAIPIDRDLRTAQRAIQRRYRRVVRTTTAELERLGGDPAALADPAANSILAALRSTVDDLDRLRIADELTAEMTSLRPGAAGEFRRRIRGWCRMLGEDSTRASGAAAIDGLSEAFTMFAPVAFEDRLNEFDPALDRLTGGRRLEILERIATTRAAWADEVANGELDGASHAEMRRLARLGTILRSIQSILEAELLANAEICNRWGGWFTARVDLSWIARTLLPGVRLASIAAADGDAARFERDLSRLESQTPPLRLVDWLGGRLALPMGDDLSGGLTTIAALSIPPGTEAWGADLRVDLASVCRGFAELAAARARKDDRQTMKRLTTYLVDASGDLLARITAGSAGQQEIRP